MFADQQSLIDLIQSVRRNRAILIANEQATKQGVVLPLLARLGWDRDNIAEVVPEYAAGRGRVDYCLRRGDVPLVFVEVKRLDEALDGHQEQLLRYAFEQGVALAALTDGMKWWLYLPTQSGSWEQRKFFTISLEEQPPPEVAENLKRFLDKSAVATGAALAAAQALHASRAKERQIREAIPEAWRELCEQADTALLELLSEKVEGRCGHKPDPEMLAEFIVKVGSRPPPAALPPKKGETPPERSEPSPSPDQWTFRKPVSFRFLGEQHSVSRFKDILLGVARVLFKRHHDQFWDRVSELRSGRGKPYYTREPNRLQEPREIEGTGIWVETCFSANDIRERSHELLAAFGYAPSELVVELRSIDS